METEELRLEIPQPHTAQSSRDKEPRQAFEEEQRKMQPPPPPPSTKPKRGASVGKNEEPKAEIAQKLNQVESLSNADDKRSSFLSYVKKRTSFFGSKGALADKSTEPLKDESPTKDKMKRGGSFLGMKERSNSGNNLNQSQEKLSISGPVLVSTTNTLSTPTATTPISPAQTPVEPVIRLREYRPQPSLSGKQSQKTVSPSNANAPQLPDLQGEDFLVLDAVKVEKLPKSKPSVREDNTRRITILEEQVRLLQTTVEQLQKDNKQLSELVKSLQHSL
ncbi:hypothetical protein EDD86DRAFT_212164 [Gorgonomyces haynaldii]|nr:hypothetical protein EDD86DRAFT_212164 [Gorgonomyces haynaldii]